MGSSKLLGIDELLDVMAESLAAHFICSSGRRRRGESDIIIGTWSLRISKRVFGSSNLCVPMYVNSLPFLYRRQSKGTEISHGHLPPFQ